MVASSRRRALAKCEVTCLLVNEIESVVLTGARSSQPGMRRLEATTTYEPLLADMTFDGVFLIEYEPLEDPEDGIRRSLDYLKSVVEDVRFE